MRFNVVPATRVEAALTITPATDLKTGIDPLLIPEGVSIPPRVPTRFLSLNETFDA